MDLTDNIFKWLVTILICGGALAGLGFAIYYKYYWESDEFLSSLDRLANVWLSLGVFGCCSFMSYFVIEIWEEK